MKKFDLTLLEDVDLGFTKMDGFDDCIIGIVERFGSEPILCYDRQAVLEKLMEDGMTHEEAEEYFSFNQIGAWVGETTPCFLSTEI
jgi:hypothetical protein